ncbi:hypothetical protein [Isoptericola sp. NPDC057653]|uniref:hypothetical protein n=1 Tax=Isoptericola sp. NPDC057653 TaxID=3346195 RepID=UPI00368C5CCA
MAPPNRALPVDPERARGLVLRWAGPTLAAPDLDHLAVDLVNVGTTPWAPREGEHLLAVGVLRSAGKERGGFGFAYAGSELFAVPLDPGEYARLPVRVGGSEWARARPGQTLVDAVLPGIGLGTETPLTLDLTAADIAGRRPETSSPQEEATALRRRLDRTTALLAARSVLPRLVDEVLAAASDDDAVTRVAVTLGCDEDSARTVAHGGLVQYRSAERLEREVSDLRRRLEAST